MSVRRVAAVDCGTNSLRLLVADVDPTTRALTDVLRTMQVVRLGEGVDRTGRVSAQALARTAAGCHEYAERCRELGVRSVRMVATSASRDADNADEVRRVLHDAFGDLDVWPEVISGEQEAALSFAGATGDLVAAAVPGPYLVADLGGGSTELVRGRVDDGRTVVEGSRSLDMGCVRHTERYLRHDPPTADEVRAALAEVDAQLDLAAADVPLAGVRTLVGVAGTVTTVTAHLLGLATYDSTRIHLARADAAQVREACRELVAMPRERRAALGFMHPGRVDVIAAGALAWGRIVERVVAAGADPEVVASEHDILDGVALDLATR